VASDIVERQLPRKESNVASSASSEETPKNFDRPEDDLRGHLIRMNRSWWLGLERHFKSQGLSVAAGIRQVLYRYMRDNGIRPIYSDDEE
jgi:hypothetical protein